MIENIQSICVNMAYACAAGVGTVVVAYGVARGMKFLAGGVKCLAAVSLAGSLIFGGMVVTSVHLAAAKTNGVNQVEGGTNTVTQIEGTNTVGQIAGEGTNGTGTVSGPLMLGHFGRPNLMQGQSPTITDEDVAFGWRVASVSSNALPATTFTMPTNATVWESAQASGRGWGAWRIPLDGWHFTYGDDGWTNGFAWVEGYFRSRFNSRANEIRLLSERLTLCPAAHWSRYNLAASRAWCATNDVDGLVVTFENAAAGDDPTKIASVQMELFPRTGEVALRYDLVNVGDVTYTAGLVIDGTNRFVEVGAGTREVVFRRVHPYDWDMDGIPNSIDDTPREPSPNTGYNQTDAWAMAAFPSNSAEIATMGYAAWVAARAAETNRHQVSLAVTSPKGAWPVCLSVGDKQVMCDGKAELKFVLDDGAKYWFSLADGELDAFSVSGMNGVETAGWLGWGYPFETTVGGVTLHLDSPSEGWMGSLANVGITLDGREVADFGRYNDAGGIFGHFVPGELHVLTGEVHQCHSNAFLDCTWSGGPGFIFANPHSLSTEVIWVATDSAAWATNYISLVTRYLGDYALTNTVMACVGPEHVPPTGISLSCQDVLFLNDDLRPERVYAVTVGLTATNGVTGQITLSCDGAESTLSYFKDVFLTNRIPALTFPLEISSNDWFTTSKTVFMSCAEIGEGELSATILFTNGTSCATSTVFNVIEPLQKLVTTDENGSNRYYNPSRLVYGTNAVLHVGVKGDFVPTNVKWRVVSGPGHVTNVCGFVATVEPTADSGTVVVEARFNGDSLQPRFSLPVVRKRVIPVKAFIVKRPRTERYNKWTYQKIQKLIRRTNEIFSQVGISFVVVAFEDNVGQSQNWNMAVSAIEHDDDGKAYETFSDAAWDLLNHYDGGDCVELYFVGHLVYPSLATWSEYGIFVGIDATERTLAHELGHALGLDDVFPIHQQKIGGRYVTTELDCIDEPVNRKTLTGEHDWGHEGGRGYYERSDTHRVVLEKLLMFGYSGAMSFDIPDGLALGLRKGTRDRTDHHYSEAGAFNMHQNNIEVFSK